MLERELLDLAALGVVEGVEQGDQLVGGLEDPTPDVERKSFESDERLDEEREKLPPVGAVRRPRADEAAVERQTEVVGQRRGSVPGLEDLADDRALLLPRHRLRARDEQVDVEDLRGQLHGTRRRRGELRTQLGHEGARARVGALDEVPDECLAVGERRSRAVREQ